MAAVDFDMTRKKDEFLSNFTGLYDEELFDSNVVWEQRELREILGGNDQQSRGVETNATEKYLAVFVGGDVKESKRCLDRTATLRCLLLETLLVAFDEGFDAGAKFGGSDNAAMSSSLPLIESGTSEMFIRYLMRLALMLTADVKC